MAKISELNNLQSEMMEWRHHLHAHPETAFQEKNTAAYITEMLQSSGLKVTNSIGGTGLVAVLNKGKKPVRSIGLRADMDALDITEETDLDYRSTIPGKMHACGHDGHIAMLLGAAKYLTLNGAFNGTVNFIFQPAEENEGGGKSMIEDGLFERFPMDSVFGLHSFPYPPEGCFGIRPGPALAAFDIFEITLIGRGGHAAMPNMSRDPMVAAAHLVAMLQTILSRNIDPVETAVISVTEIKGGTTYNVIPESVKLRGTTRHFQPVIQDLIEQRIKEILRGTELAFGVTAELTYERRYPPVVNAVKETGEAIKAATATVGANMVLSGMPPVMGSEDFAFMLKAKPGAYMMIGAGAPRPGGMVHQPKFDFNDRLLSIGACYWVNLVEMLLPVT